MFHLIAKLKKKLQCTINGDKVKSFHNTVQCMYGVDIPHDTREAFKVDEENGNDNWKEVIRLEIQHLMDCNSFIDKGLRQCVSNDYTEIRCHMIFAVKHNG